MEVVRDAVLGVVRGVGGCCGSGITAGAIPRWFALATAVDGTVWRQKPPWLMNAPARRPAAG